jgi:hypothetical protein
MQAHSPGLLRRLSYVFQLPDEVKREISLVDDEEYDNDLAMRWWSTIPERMGPALFTGNRGDQIAAAMDDASLNSLEYCSFVLHRYRPQRVFSTRELDTINELIRELQAEVEGDDAMDRSLQDFLLYHAFAMSRALDELGLRGPVALEEAFDQAVGAAQRRVDLTVRRESNSGAWTKFLNLIVGVAAVLQITTTAFVLPGQVRQELDGPPPSRPSVVEVIQVSPHNPALVVPMVEKVPESQGAG